MMTNFTLKTGVLPVVFLLLSISVFAQRPTPSQGNTLPLKNRLALKGQSLPDVQVDPNDTITLIDTVMLLEKSSSAMHFRINPKEGTTMWRYRVLGDVPVDMEVAVDQWISGLASDTCCISLENLDAETSYVVQFGRMNNSQPLPSVWYSMVETTRCTGPSLDQLKLIGLDHNSASMMCEMEAEAFDWVLRKVGSASARHIETSTNTIEWTNLPPNTAHESRVRFMCGGIWSDYSPADIFTTNEYEEVHCDTLESDHVYTSDINPNYVKLNCTMAGNQFSWGLRLAGANSWTIFTTAEDHYDWTGLKPGTTYEYKVKVECQSDSWTDWSNTHYFTTKEAPQPCYPPTSGYMTVKNISYNSASTYCVMDGTEYHWAMRAYGSSSWKDYSSPKNYYHWTGLKYNTKYEYKVKVKCTSGSWTGWSDSYWFTTHDHYQNSCSTPQSHHMSVKNLTYHSAITHCSVDGYQYHWMMREYGSNNWLDFTSSDNFYSWTNLHYNTKYEYKVKVKCHSGSWTGWSNSYWFSTPDHYGSSCTTPQSHHMSVQDLTYNSATTHCSVDGYGYHWMMRPYGSSQWLDHESTYNYHNWTGLNYNTKYEYKVKVKCYDGSWTGWSGSYWFTTPDHYGSSCSTPQSHHMSVKDVTYNSASTYCSVEGYEYHWMLKAYGSSNWIDYSTPNAYYHWTNLKYNTKYEYKVKVKCYGGTWTGWSDSYWFTTPDHYGSSCSTPQSHHMSVKDLTYNSATTHCAVNGYEYHWALRPYGSSSWMDYTSTVSYHQWEGLHYNTKYEYKVKVKCNSTNWTDWSDIYWFTTPDHYGGCSTPQSHHMTVKNITYNSASTHCSMDGYQYHWAIRKYGSYGWTDYTSNYNYYDWKNLNYNTKYEYKVKVKCHDGYWTDWSDAYWFNTHDHYSNCSTPESHHMSADNISYNSATTHCGVTGVEYHWMMRPYGSSSWEDHVTGNNYHNWTNLHYNTKYEYKVKVKCSSTTWTNWSGSYYFTTHDHGGYGCSAPAGYDFTIHQQDYNLFRIYLYTSFTKWSSQIRKAGSYEWSQHTTTVNNMAWGNLDSNTEYEYRVNRTCADGTTSSWSAIRTFWTGVGTASTNGRDVGSLGLEVETGIQAIESSELQVFPNPASHNITLVGVAPEAEVTIVDMQGRMVLQRTLSQRDQLNIERLENGIYQILALDKSGHLQTKRLSVVK